MKPKFDKDTLKTISECRIALDAVLQQGRDYWEDKSEKWQDSDVGTNYAAWLDEIETTLEALEALPDEASA